LSSFRLPPCGLSSVFSWPSTFAGLGESVVAPAFSAAPLAGLTLARETHRSENQTASITNRIGKSAVLIEKVAALLNA
jgi:hypothetical protein